MVPYSGSISEGMASIGEGAYRGMIKNISDLAESPVFKVEDSLHNRLQCSQPRVSLLQGRQPCPQYETSGSYLR